MLGRLGDSVCDAQVVFSCGGFTSVFNPSCRVIDVYSCARIEGRQRPYTRGGMEKILRMLAVVSFMLLHKNF